MPATDSVSRFRDRANRRLFMALSNTWGGLNWRELLRERLATEVAAVKQAEARVVLGVDDLILHRYFGSIPQPPADLVDDAERLIVSSMRIPSQDLAPLTFTLLDALIESGSSTGAYVDQSIHAYGRRIFDAAAT
jgi:predicted signal transduction protein with EAL and GGDEF domain